MGICSQIQFGSQKIIKKEEIINNKTKTYEYAYDKLGRLIKVTKDGNVVEEYSYDANSNRISAKINGKNINATYNQEDQLTSYNNTTYTYDKNGNLIKKQNDTNQTSYSYDEFNNLKAVTLPNNKTVSYITNPLNQRVAKLINGKITQKYQWKDLTTLLAIYDKDNNLIQRFEYANGRMPIAMTDKNNNRYYLHYDQVGSLRAVTDTNGNLIKEITYDSYGNIISDINPDFKVPFGFAAGLYDEDTKLVHFGYREYDPEIGRWLGKDPLLFGGGDSNLYGYVLQDPVNLVDPLGLWSISLEFYAGWGGGITFGKNPDGKYFLSIKAGVGVGGGLGYDSNGKSNNYKKDGCYGIGVGFTGGAYINPLIGTLGYEGSFGATTGAKNIPDSLYSSSGFNTFFNDNTKGLKASINANGEFIFTW